MNNLSTIESKENCIIATILYCNNVIGKINESQKRGSVMKRLFENTDEIRFSYMGLAAKAQGTDIRTFKNNSESFIEENTFVKMNEHNNYYVFLKQVREFLNGFELGIQSNLNESINIYIPEPKQLGKGTPINVKETMGVNAGEKVVERKAKQKPVTDIEAFKEKLNRYIYELEQINDVERYQTYDKQILQTKIFSGQPIFVCGFNIVNNLVFQREISEKFGLNVDSLLAIWYDITGKRLLFIFPNDCISYRITNDDLIRPQKSIKFKNENYVDVFKEHVTNNYIVLFQNVSDVKFTDNLYKDSKLQSVMQNAKSMSNIVKF